MNIREFTCTEAESNRFGFLVFLIFAFCVLLPYGVLHGWDELRDGLVWFYSRIEITLPVFLIGFVMHELLHALAIILCGGVHIRDIQIGLSRTNYSPYTHCKTPLLSRVYRVSLMSPVLLLGLIPAVLALIMGWAVLCFFSLVFVVTSSGDLLIFSKLWRVSPNVLLQDHPTQPGCIAYE